MSHADEPTYYELLGVNPTASDEEIRSAYRELAKHAHPDRGGNAALFRLIQIAYDTLKDPSERSAYDRNLGGSAGPAQRPEEPPPRSQPDARSGESQRTTSSQSEGDSVYARRAHFELFFALSQWLDTNMKRALAGGSEVQTAIDYLTFKLESWQREFADRMSRAGYGSSVDEVKSLRDEIEGARYAYTDPGPNIVQAVDERAVLLAEALAVDYKPRGARPGNGMGPRTQSQDRSSSTKSGHSRDGQIEEYLQYLSNWHETHTDWGGDHKSMRREAETLLRAVSNWRSRLMAGPHARPVDDHLCCEMLWLLNWVEYRLRKGRNFGLHDLREVNHLVGKAMERLTTGSDSGYSIGPSLLDFLEAWYRAYETSRLGVTDLELLQANLEVYAAESGSIEPAGSHEVRRLIQAIAPEIETIGTLDQRPDGIKKGYREGKASANVRFEVARAIRMLGGSIR